MTESQRIRQEYLRRERTIDPAFYSLTKPVNLFVTQQRTRYVLAVLERERFFPLQFRRILDIGCGPGRWLADFEAWGARRGNLAGIDLLEAPVAEARRLLSSHRDEQGSLIAPGADIQLGDAADLPWKDGSFDLVLQSGVFTSVLDSATKKTLAAEMLRVLRVEGLILWYDFFYNNPHNPNVRGVGKHELKVLFPDCSISLRRITLAPPLARRVVPVTWLGALILENLRFLNTHYLGVIRKQRASTQLPAGSLKRGLMRQANNYTIHTRHR